ncbi:ABC transporter ATP-binding protein [Elioraea tepidiphila]|jgi:oligopeptide/dipeptide ABC transporter ATP-binding protein|uniref:ABC transporter ATP-binding protein n=1 Tax=Elioraea tepidiphila TaxID=457934 RepID=UPI002FDB3D0B
MRAADTASARDAASGGAPLLEVVGLTTTLVATGASVLEDIAFTVEAGETLCVVGESGSGKSMLALAIMGLLPPAIRIRRGEIRVHGEDLARLSPAEWRARRGRDLAMIFQEPMTALNPVMRAGAQVAEVLRKRRGMTDDAARGEALRLFERVGIPNARARLSAYPHELSGGLRQRVMIAIALAAEARLLLADEPTTALDVTIQAQILDLLNDLRRERGLGLMLITHDLGVVAEMADRVLVLYAGRMAELAPVAALFDRPMHPYTRALLASIPTSEGPRTRLVAIDGAVPAVGAMPQGCRFRPRCSLADARCETVPPLVAHEPRHHAACWATAPQDRAS